MLESYKWMGLGWDGYGMGWKSLRGVILRAPLCGANKKEKLCFVISSILDIILSDSMAGNVRSTYILRSFCKLSYFSYVTKLEL